MAVAAAASKPERPAAVTAAFGAIEAEPAYAALLDRLMRPTKAQRSCGGADDEGATGGSGGGGGGVGLSRDTARTVLQSGAFVLCTALLTGHVPLGPATSPADNIAPVAVGADGSGLITAAAAAAASARVVHSEESIRCDRAAWAGAGGRWALMVQFSRDCWARALRAVNALATTPAALLPPAPDAAASPAPAGTTTAIGQAVRASVHKLLAAYSVGPGRGTVGLPLADARAIVARLCACGVWTAHTLTLARDDKSLSSTEQADSEDVDGLPVLLMALSHAYRRYGLVQALLEQTALAPVLLERVLTSEPHTRLLRSGMEDAVHLLCHPGTELPADMRGDAYGWPDVPALVVLFYRALPLWALNDPKCGLFEPRCTHTAAELRFILAPGGATEGGAERGDITLARPAHDDWVDMFRRKHWSLLHSAAHRCAQTADYPTLRAGANDALRLLQDAQHQFVAYYRALWAALNSDSFAALTRGMLPPLWRLVVAYMCAPPNTLTYEQALAASERDETLFFAKLAR